MKVKFTEKVLAIVNNIPKGKVLTYGEVARLAGAYGAGRAVGNILRKNSDKNVPCHRVVKVNGACGKYNSLQGKSKKKILSSEGVKFSRNGKVIF